MGSKKKMGIRRRLDKQKSRVIFYNKSWNNIGRFRPDHLESTILKITGKISVLVIYSLAF